MRQAITNFLTLNPQNLPSDVYLALAVGYAFLMFLFTLDVITKLKGIPVKIIWLFLIYLVPILGMYAYVLYSLLKVEYKFMERFHFGKKPARIKKP